MFAERREKIVVEHLNRLNQLRAVFSFSVTDNLRTKVVQGVPEAGGVGRASSAKGANPRIKTFVESVSGMGLPAVHSYTLKISMTFVMMIDIAWISRANSALMAPRFNHGVFAACSIHIAILHENTS